MTTGNSESSKDQENSAKGPVHSNPGGAGPGAHLQEARQQLATSQDMLQALFQQGRDLMFVHQPASPRGEGWVVQVNQSAALRLGYNQKELLGLNISDLVEAASELNLALEGSDPAPPALSALKAKGGASVLCEVYSHRLNLAGVDYLLTVARDLGRWGSRQSQQEMTEAVFEHSRDAIAITDASGIIRTVNSAFTTLTGYASGEATGQPAHQLLADNSARAGDEQGWPELGITRRWQGQLFTQAKGGKPCRLGLILNAIHDRKERVTGYVALLHDLRHPKEHEEQLRHLSHHDPITGLHNRVHFMASLSELLAKEGASQQMVAVLLADLDNFKNINDSLGHAVGDLFLKQVAERLSGCVRSADAVARLGGDEFTILLSNVRNKPNALHAARRLLYSLSEPLKLEGKELFASASIGIAVYPSDGSDAEALVRNAELAMRQAKEQGKQNCQLYSPALDRYSAERLELESHLRKALANREFRVHYQPILDLQTGQVAGMEALVRWARPGWGLVPPAQFIPMAEETGLIVPIGEWTLMDACRQAKQWHDQGKENLRLSVNLSARQLLWQHDIVQMVEECLRMSGLDPQFLELEMTESAVMHNVEAAIATMSKLSSMGVRLALDDFGTGYSSLNYLMRFPLNTLKIDRSFVKDIPHDPNGVAIVNGIISMARSLKLKVVAEGVEDRQQLDFLRANNCDRMQGFIFSPPVSPQDFEHILKEDRRIRL